MDDKIIQIMKAEIEAKKIIYEYKDNGSLLGKIMILDANKIRLENARHYVDSVTKSMESVNHSSKKLKSSLDKSFKGAKFTNRVDVIMEKLQTHQDAFGETLDELGLVTEYLNHDDDDDDIASGGGDVQQCGFRDIPSLPSPSSLPCQSLDNVSNSVKQQPQNCPKEGPSTHPQLENPCV